VRASAVGGILYFPSVYNNYILFISCVYFTLCGPGVPLSFFLYLSLFSLFPGTYPLLVIQACISYGGCFFLLPEFPNCFPHLFGILHISWALSFHFLLEALDPASVLYFPWGIWVSACLLNLVAICELKLVLEIVLFAYCASLLPPFIKSACCGVWGVLEHCTSTVLNSGGSWHFLVFFIFMPG